MRVAFLLTVLGNNGSDPEYAHYDRNYVIKTSWIILASSWVNGKLSLYSQIPFDKFMASESITNVSQKSCLFPLLLCDFG